MKSVRRNYRYQHTFVGKQKERHHDDRIDNTPPEKGLMRLGKKIG